MDDLDLPRPTLVSALQPPFDLSRPAEDGAPLVYASPHSGRLYPAEMMAAAVLDAPAIRRSEDAWVDTLLEGVERWGVSLLCARFARVFMDVNREAYELDQAMFEDLLPTFAQLRTPRVAAGLGAIARVVAEGQEIYGRKLAFAEARARIEAVHRPYHRTLTALLAELKAGHGRVAMIDWHSMPSAAARPSRRARPADIVLGDRFGASCAPGLTALVERELKALGYEVARNTPYAGGYTTEHYGAPQDGVHVLQVEISRSLYLDEAAVTPAAGFDKLRQDLQALTAALAARWREAI